LIKKKNKLLVQHLNENNIKENVTKTINTILDLENDTQIKILDENTNTELLV